MKTDFESAIIVDDSDDESHDNNDIKNNLENEIILTKKPRTRKVQEPLKKYLYEDINKIEIGVDEAGRGPLFGRVYTGAVILPKDDSFDHFKMKDSKKFNSKTPQKIQEVAEYIKKNAVAWYVSFEDEKVIDEINILQATQSAMHKSIFEVRKQYIQKMNSTAEKTDYSINLLIDGNYFNPITIVNKKTNKLDTIPYTCVEGGDNKYTAIAAASILAKVERDRYIDELCFEHPELIEKYAINSNKGYGAKKHIDGIKAHGITIWHRRSFGICKNYN